MAIVQLKDVRERRPVLMTIFTVEPYWLDRDRLVQGLPKQFTAMEPALRAAKAAAVRAPFVRVCRIRGNIEADYWEDKVTVASFGDMCRPPGSH